jgi:hypothetical protein
MASVLVTRFGLKPVLLGGLTLITIGLLWFTQLPIDGRYLADIIGPSLLVAIGLGCSFVPVTIAALSGVAEHDSGLASGLINTSQQIGGALGLAVLATIASTRTLDLVEGAGGAPSALPGALTDGFNLAFLGGAGFALLGILVALMMIRGSDSRAVVGASRADLPLA